MLTNSSHLSNSSMYYKIFPLKNREALDKFDFLDLAKSKVQESISSLEYLDLSSFFIIKVGSDSIQCWSCNDTLELKEGNSSEFDFYGHMVSLKNKEHSHVQRVALHVICFPCNKNLLDEGSLDYMDRCPFKCGSNEMRHRISIHSSGLVLKTEHLPSQQISQIKWVKAREAIGACLKIIQIVALGILSRIASTAVSLVFIAIIMTPGVRIVVFIGKISQKVFQENNS